MARWPPKSQTSSETPTQACQKEYAMSISLFIEAQKTGTLNLSFEEVLAALASDSFSEDWFSREDDYYDK